MMAAAQSETGVEAPVNPYSLLGAVNASSETVNTGWLIFLALMAYVLIAVAGVTHKDILLQTPVTLPILQVSIPLRQFFMFAPVVLALFHLGVVAQLVLLARKTLEFDRAVRPLEASDRRAHPLRLELHNFFFVQAIAGPDRSRVMSAFLHGMSWLTTLILPVLLLLYIQLAFLPYHDVTVTAVQRVALVADLCVLLLVGTFLLQTEASFFKALVSNARAHPLNVAVTTVVLLFAGFISFFVATVPGELLDKTAQTLIGAPEPAAVRARDHRAGGFTWPMFASRTDGTLFGMFHRNLLVTDADLVSDKEVTADEPTISLRGRDLRYARLDRSDLHQGDLTGADLSGASLVGADLRRISLTCDDVGELLLTGDRRKAGCGAARAANFTRARLDGARLSGTDFTAARFDDASLEAVELAYALATGASFAGAHLDKADLSGGVRAEGANFLLASLQGADLTGAHLQAADFSNASLQGAILTFADLQAAKLRTADLEAASLIRAKLQGADFTGAKVTAADFHGAAVWMTAPPLAESAGSLGSGSLSPELASSGAARTAFVSSSTDSPSLLDPGSVGPNSVSPNSIMPSTLPLSPEKLSPEKLGPEKLGPEMQSPETHGPVSHGMANFRDLQIQALGDGARTALTGLKERLRGARGSARVAEALEPLLSGKDSASWGAGAAFAAWKARSAGQDAELADVAKSRLTDHLLSLMCRARAPAGALATGIVRRAQAAHFMGDAAAISERSRREDCTGAKSVPPAVLSGLARAVEAAAAK